MNVGPHIDVGRQLLVLRKVRTCETAFRKESGPLGLLSPGNREPEDRPEYRASEEMFFHNATIEVVEKFAVHHNTAK